jgi:hypothetical protein
MISDSVTDLHSGPLAASHQAHRPPVDTATSARVIDDFSTGSTGNLFYDGAMAPAPVTRSLGSMTAATIPGGARELSMIPLATGAGVATFGTNTAAAPPALIATASPGEHLYVSIGYGNRENMHLDLSGYNAFRLQVQWLGAGSKPALLNLQIYANTVEPPGTNGTGSYWNDNIPSAGIFDVPFSDLKEQIVGDLHLPVNWAHVDRLGFAFSGSGPTGQQTLAGFRINSISVVRKP